VNVVSDRHGEVGTGRPPFPIFDAHMHLDPEGRGVEAAREFERAGGTGFMLVTKPYRSVRCSTAEGFSENYDVTISMAQRVRESTSLEVMVAVGPHPAELPRLAGELGLEGAVGVMLAALEKAGNLVRDGKAHALGEIGRPHFPVEPAVWDASNAILSQGLRLAHELDCAAVLHTESAGPGVFAELAVLARAEGISLDRTVKHFSAPVIRLEENAGLFPSVIAGKDALEQALSQGTRFMLETDYIDDLKRPGAVLGPATVPKKTLRLFREGGLSEKQAWVIHSENPRKVFGTGV
jgi:TatD-related deoxyribonuclease